MKLTGLPRFILQPLLGLAERWPWLGAKLNRIAINTMVSSCRYRPHPWSTVSDYTSWLSLTDMTWSARHLPAKTLTDLPPIDELAEFFRRPAEQVLSPKSTCLFPSFAQYLTDGFIRTRMPVGDESDQVRKRNTSNHQIDLCALYGRLQSHTDALRLKSSTPGQLGRLKSQMIGSEEYPPFLMGPDGKVKPEFKDLDPPLGISNVTDPDQLSKIFAVGGDRANTTPQIAMMNTLFLREHNRLAGELERANPTWDDERVFQTARNIVIVVFIKIVVEEYINHINPLPMTLKADPSVAWNAPWNKPNWITTEFSLLYRWHSLIPDVISWGGKPYPIGSTMLDTRPLLETGLLQGFIDMSSQAAGHLEAFNTTAALVPIEESAINQGRICCVAAYVDYRKYLGLPVPTDFSQVSSRKEVVDFLRSKYKRVEDVEFYIGLFAEDTVPNSPLPELLQGMVAVDAFSQALTNPLLSEHVFNEETFTKLGMNCIKNTASLRDILNRNTVGVGDARISMTQSTWKFKW